MFVCLDPFGFKTGSLWLKSKNRADCFGVCLPAERLKSKSTLVLWLRETSGLFFLLIFSWLLTYCHWLFFKYQFYEQVKIHETILKVQSKSNEKNKPKVKETLSTTLSSVIFIHAGQVKWIERQKNFLYNHSPTSHLKVLLDISRSILLSFIIAH